MSASSCKLHSSGTKSYLHTQTFGLKSVVISLVYVHGLGVDGSHAGQTADTDMDTDRLRKSREHISPAHQLDRQGDNDNDHEKENTRDARPAHACTR